MFWLFNRQTNEGSEFLKKLWCCVLLGVGVGVCVLQDDLVLTTEFLL